MPVRIAAERAGVHNPALFYRATTLRKEDAKDGRLSFTFSSEARVERWYGGEILLHGPDNVMLGRLNSIGAVLFNHNPDAIVGAVQSAEIGADRKGHAVAKFDDTPEGKVAQTRVESGSLRGVSVGYLIHKFRDVHKGEEYEGIKGPCMVATKWEPIEVSLTPIPADSHVGVGRDATRSLDGIEIEASPSAMEKAMNEQIRQYLVSRGLPANATDEQATAFLSTLGAADAELKRKAEAPKPEEKPAEKPAEKPPETRMLTPEEVAELFELAGHCRVELAFVTDAIAAKKTPVQIRTLLIRKADAVRTPPVGVGDQPLDEKNAEKELAAVSDKDLARAVCELEV